MATTRFITVCLCLMLSNQVFAGKTEVEEYQIKAAFLYNFTKFVQWPKHKLNETDDHLKLCTLGINPFGTILNALKNQKTQGYPIEVIEHDELSEIDDCHVLFISAEINIKLTDIYEYSQDNEILTVSDMEDFAAGGGMMQLKLVKKRVRFIVNVTSAKAADLRISARLLRIALELYKD